MGIKELQKGGQKFRMSYGAGNFKQQLNRQTLHGELQNLRDNKKSILEVVDQYKGYIRRDVMGRKLQKQAYKKILKKEGAKLTYGDKKDIKKILKHFSEKDSTGEKPESVPAINRAEIDDPSNLAPDSLVKKVGSRFVIKSEIDNKNIQNNPSNLSNQLDSNTLDIHKINNPIDYHALGLIKRDRIISKRINIQRAENPIIPKPANQAEDFERKESILAASPIKNVGKPVDVKKAETPIASKSASVKKAEAPIVHQPINIEKTETPAPSQEENPIDYHALGLIKREKIVSKRINIQRAENPIIPKPANQAEDFERKESILAASPLKNVGKPVDVKKMETPIASKSASVKKAENPIAKKVETPVVHQPINIEKAETPVVPQEDNPIDYHALGLIKRKTTPLKPRLVNIEKAETPVVPKPVKNIAKPVDVKKMETPITPKSASVEKAETPIVEKAKTPIVHQPTNIERKETPVVPPPIEVKKKIIIQRAENPDENPLTPKAVKADKKENPVAHESIIFDKPINIKKNENPAEKPIAPEQINIQKAEAQPDKDIPNIADLKEPAPDNIPSPDNNISPSEEEVRTNRGDAVRAKINYEHALDLGGSEAAQDIQKKAFEKMNNINNSLNA